MATYQLSQVNGSTIAFKPATDVLMVDVGSAADVILAPLGTSLSVTLGDLSVTLLNTVRGRLTTGNVVFADGSQLIVGDNTTGTSGDKSANLLVGSAGDDRLIGLGGNDTMDGGDGSDVYEVIGTSDGANVYHDTGSIGVDKIVAGAAGTNISLIGTFSAAASGIEAMSGNGYSNVRIVGGGAADTLDFSGMSLTGIALIDGGKGNDVIVGSAGADTILGGTGNDTVDGGAGTDVAVFNGLKGTYAIETLGNQVKVTDNAPSKNGNDGTDLLKNVEVLRFLDGDIVLGGPPVAANDAAAATEDGAPVAIDVLANDSDPYGEPISVVAVDGTGLKGSVAVDAGGTGVTYSVGNAFQSLHAGETATEAFSYTIADASGHQATASVAVTVTGVNDGPVAADDAATMSEDAGAAAIAVLANDSDPDAGDGMTVVAVDGSALAGTVSIDAGGTGITYAPGVAFQSLAAGESAVETLTYTIADAAGATSTANVTVTVTGANDAPTANADAANASSTVPQVIDVLANDADADNGDVLTLVGASVAPGQGAVSIVNDQLVFDPGADFAGLAAGASTDVLASYTVQDAAGATATADVTITVTAPDGGPLIPPGGPFTVIDPAQAGTQSAAIANAILGNAPGIAIDAGALNITAGPSSTMFYDGSLAALGIGPGLLLTSGTVPGTENTVGYFGVDNNMPGDPALDAVVNTVFSTVSYDASSISFPFTVNDPTVTGISLNVVFGSDEFPEWVDAFVDIGVVLVNGVNVAYFNSDPLAPLSVVGSNLAANYFLDNTANLDTASFGGVAVPGVPSTLPIEYDGISHVLSILAPVHLGVNTIKIGIADTGDHIYDSGLFISNLTATDVPTSGVVLNVPCTEGNDDKVGTDASEVFDALGGDDTVDAGGGNDVVLGGIGNDTLGGGAGNDFCDGGDGDDSLSGGAGDDHLDGGAGSDTAVFGGSSADYVVTQIGADQYQVSGGDGTDIVVGVEFASFADGAFDFASLAGTPTAPDGVTIQGTAGDDIVNASQTVSGQPLPTAMADVVYGGGGDDMIATGDGADTVYGETGNDQIDAGNGNDMIVGGAGADELTGGLGADRFVYVATADSAPSGSDKIYDFNALEGDRIDLTMIDASTATPNDDAFVLAAAFHGIAGELVIANAADSSLLVSGDVDGDGLADIAILVKDVAALNAGDFWL